MRKIKPEIIADTRESSTIIGHLERLGARIKLQMISPGDYIVAEGFTVERKSFGDFLRSIFDKRLFEQVRRLSGAYPRHCLLIEGDVGYELAHLRNPLVFWGALSKLVAEFGTPLVFTVNEEQSAEFLFSLAKKCQEERPEELLVARYKPKAYSLMQMQLLAVQGLPEIGPTLADRLLQRFKTVRGVFKAHPIELRSIPGIGSEKERKITRFLDAPYLAPERSNR